MSAWGAPRTAVELACFGVSELIANVGRHVADLHCCLQITHCGLTALVSVYDRSPCLPVVTEPDWDSESGRGLWLLRQMTGECGFGFGPATDPWEKAVWFRCDLGPSGGAA